VRDTLAPSQLSVGHVDILQKLGSLKELLVLGDIQKDGSSTAVLREHERPAGLLDLAHERSRVRTEL
jgi:hypothetical protein